MCDYVYNYTEIPEKLSCEYWLQIFKFVSTVKEVIPSNIEQLEYNSPAAQITVSNWP